METSLKKPKDNSIEDPKSQSTPTMAFANEKQSHEAPEGLLSLRDSEERKPDRPQDTPDETVYPPAASVAIIMFSCWLAMFLVALVGPQKSKVHAPTKV
jgi:hypothetical protein